MKVKSESEVVQSCPTLHDPMDCSLLGSSVHGIFQARVLQWDAITLGGQKPKGRKNSTYKESIQLSLKPGERRTLKKYFKKKKMKRQRNTTQIKKQTRNREVQINEEEIGKVPENEFRIMIVKMIKNVENKMEKIQETINKDLEELKNKHTETNNRITEIKYTLEEINSRISEAEERFSELGYKMVEITTEEQYKVKE